MWALVKIALLCKQIDLNTGSMLMWKRLVGHCVMNTIFQRISIAFIDWYLLKKQVEVEKTIMKISYF
ncbi:hypothetical protein T12_12836 [Trichinella patagoniensis]|uniref:Uncharacterized protein n=1 Tax=Trichinella patagoniensis TaxID=990121 RepID=A0A0V1ADE8_9BILA|nr:hypothetical protein T12_12836 [Trichinella patagoniensis]